MREPRRRRGWLEAATLAAAVSMYPPVALAQFWEPDTGQSIAVSGSTVVMGEPNEGVLHVYDWDQANGELTYLESLTVPGSADLGWSVALTGHLLAAGTEASGNVEIFRRESGNWLHEETIDWIDPTFGRWLDLNGPHLIVGSESTVYLFEIVDNAWVQRDIITNPPDLPLHGAVAVNGNTAVVSSDRSVAVLQYQEDDWVQEALLHADAGPSAIHDVEIQLPHLVFHIPTARELGTGAYIYEHVDGEWIRQDRIRGNVDVDLDGDGGSGKNGGDLNELLTDFGKTGEDVIGDAVMDGVVDLLDLGAIAATRGCGGYGWDARARHAAQLDGDRLAVVSQWEYLDTCSYQSIVRTYERTDGVWVRINKHSLGPDDHLAATISGDYLLVNRIGVVDEEVIDLRQPGIDPRELSHEIVEVPIDWDAVANDGVADLVPPARCFDLQVMIADAAHRTDWTATDVGVSTNAVLFQHLLGTDIAPNPAFLPTFPALEYDCFFAAPPDLFDNISPGFASDPRWTDQTVEAVWYDTPRDGPGTYTIARFTVMGGSELTISGRSTGVAAEVTYPFSFTVDLTACFGDVDGDGDTDQSDLGILLAAYEISGEGDLDGDGDTDQADLGILLADYECGAGG